MPRSTFLASFVSAVAASAISAAAATAVNAASVSSITRDGTKLETVLFRSFDLEAPLAIELVNDGPEEIALARTLRTLLEERGVSVVGDDAAAPVRLSFRTRQDVAGKRKPPVRIFGEGGNRSDDELGVAMDWPLDLDRKPGKTPLRWMEVSLRERGRTVWTGHAEMAAKGRAAEEVDRLLAASLVGAMPYR